MTKVSVIIPTYNRARYLKEALESVLQQTLPPDEIIIVDDGSTDDTDQVIESVPGPVRFFRQDHQGVAAARNLGLEHATGDLIAWLDSDDLWEPDFLAIVVPMLAQDDALEGVYTGITMIDADGARLGSSVRVEPPERLYDVLVHDCFLATPSIVVRRACYDQVGGFDPQFRIAEDYDMWLRLADRFRIMGIPQPLVCIRVHTHNTMKDAPTLINARLALARKHFGELSNDGAMSDVSRAAYGHALRSMALMYIESGQPSDGWACFQKAATLHPAILQRLDTFYELALGDQPRGYRGQTQGLDLAANGAAMIRGLDALFTDAPPEVQALSGAAYGHAYLALAMLADQAGEWAAARRSLWKAVRSHPRLLRDPLVARRGIKLLLGRRVIGGLRRVRPGREVGRR